MKRIIVLLISVLSIATGYAQTQNLENVIVRNKLTVGDSTLNTGNVGIATKNPTQKLDVNGGVRIRSLGAGIVVSNASGVLSIDSTLTADSLRVNILTANNVKVNRDSFTDPAATIASIGDSGFIVQCAASCDDIRWTTIDGAQTVLKDITDLVGIGIISPSAKLDVVSEDIAAFKVYWADSILVPTNYNSFNIYDVGISLDANSPTESSSFIITAGGVNLNASDQLTFQNNMGDGNFLIDPNNIAGSVGIGTTTPTEKLHVAGTSLFTDTLTYTNGTEADGYVLTSDASGNATWQDHTAYGEMGFGDSTRTIAITQNVFSVVTNSNNTLWSTAAVDLHNVTYSGDSLIIDSAGVYQVNVQLSMDGTSGSVIRLGVFLNGVLACSCTGYQELLNNRILQLTYINIDALNAGDVLQVVITNTANGDDVAAIGGKITVNKIR